jgi:hypothetical protein
MTLLTQSCVTFANEPRPSQQHGIAKIYYTSFQHSIYNYIQYTMYVNLQISDDS